MSETSITTPQHRVLQVSYNGSLSQSIYTPTDPTHDRTLYASETPGMPPLHPLHPIPLPLLSPRIPIHINPFITYQPSLETPLHWNISYPPSTARLLSEIGQGAEPSRWSRNVAIVPTTVGTITIRIAIRGVALGQAETIVVFPVEAGLPIRIIDVMRAVHRDVRAAAFEYDNIPLSGRDGGSVGFAFLDDIAADAIRRHLHNRVWWHGLSSSRDEVDVWLLHLRR